MTRVIWTAEAMRAIEAALTAADPEMKEVIDVSLVRLRALLEYDAANFGESREGNVRVAFSGACGINYDVTDLDAGIVRVFHFWILTRRT